MTATGQSAQKTTISPRPENITVFLSGDVMTGRGIDQVLAYPSRPDLHESYVKDARKYVQLAERKNDPIERPVAERKNFMRFWARLFEIRFSTSGRLLVLLSLSSYSSVLSDVLTPAMISL